ncbi:MAG: dUTP diphosphatase [Bdellovibrionales bacterium]|nr:dUTP diphosphatase [Bdellovibrionales bacterium]
MEISQIKKSVSEIAKTFGALVEEKLGERSQLEEQVRGFAKNIEKVVSDTIKANAPGKVKLRFKKLEHFKGELPAYATAGAAGLDVRACIESPLTLAPGERYLIPTGLSVEIPYGYEVQVRPRSGLAISKGLGLVNSPGTIDADYRGEIKVIVINLGQEAIHIQDQERIAQLVLCPVIQAQVEEAFDLSGTERGSGGFGSTGL